MSDFSIFHPDEQNLLAGSLFKIGVWIGHADDEGEEYSDEKERQALLKVLRKGQGAFSKYPLISEMSSEALRREKYWAGWSADWDNALVDVENSIKLLSHRLVDNDVKAYKQLVMMIASSIAGAFDEDEETENSGVWGKLSGLALGVVNSDLKNELNTSPEEQEALLKLAEVFKNTK